MKKIIIFVENGRPKKNDVIIKSELESEGNQVIFSNGSMLYGFQDSCNAIVNTTGNSAIKAWAESKGITIIGDVKPKTEPEVAAVEPEQEQEETAAKTARRGRTAKQQ